MSPLTELTGIVADAQKLAISTIKEAGALSTKTLEANLSLAERVLAYQREAFLRSAGALEQQG